MVLVVGAVLLTTTVASASNVGLEWREKQCRYRNYSGGPAFNRDEIILTIRCGVQHWPVYGGATKAIDVAECESGLGQFATSAGGHQGVYQFAPSTFSGVMGRWSQLWNRWHVRRDAYNARSNILGAIRKASADGWGAWGCA
jgi:hypothetical protein